MLIKPTPEFKIELSRSTDFFSSINFSLTNLTPAPVSILTWYTPLEGLVSDCLIVCCNEKPVDYIGILLKRSTPDASDYIQMDTNETITKTVSLGSYDMSKKGRYTVECNLSIVCRLLPIRSPWNTDSNIEIKSNLLHIFDKIIKF